jgi:hypothetical protein
MALFEKGVSGHSKQGCQMVYFHTKTPKYFRRQYLEKIDIFYDNYIHTLCGHLLDSVAIWYIMWPNGIFYPFWYIASREFWQPDFKDGH